MIANKSKALLKNLGILTVSNFASRILVFLLVPLYTSVLSTEEYGTYDLAISTISLLAPILSLNIGDAVMRFLMEKSCDKGQVATIGIRYILISIVGAGTVLAVIRRFNIWNQVNGFEHLIFFYYLFYIINQYLIQFAKGLGRVKEMGIAGVAGTIAMLIANILTLLVFKLGLRGFFFANIFAQAVPSLYYIVSLNIPNYFSTSKIDKKLNQEMLYYCIPLIATVIGWCINSNSDKYVVTVFCGIAVNGLLSVAYKIPSILNTIQSIFIQAWQISAVKEYNTRNTSSFYSQTFQVTNTLMCTACSLLILLTKPLAHLLYSNDFFSAWKFVPFLLLGSVLNCASGFLGPILSAKKDSRSMALSAIIGAAANLVLNVSFVSLIGAQGVTIATAMASYLIYRIRKKAVGKTVKFDKYYTIITSWILLVIQAIIEIYVGNWLFELPLMLFILLVNLPTLKKVFLQLFAKSVKC